MKKEKKEEFRKIDYPLTDKYYEHYKGGIYKVITLAKHSETDEIMVVYQSVLFGSFHVRPLSMWFDAISVGGENKVSRFTYSHLY